MILLLSLFGVAAKAFMIGEWNITLNPTSCQFTVSHPLNPQAYVSDTQMIQLGKGNVDDIVIMENGDI
jgi:hypothetical protein